jgi:acetylornithine deacetylase/succinyl-diaminopimelate desuccinylase-like protein
LPILQPGATDGEFLNAAGIATYGIEPLFAGPDLGHIHGLNEYVSVQSLLDCRDFLYRLIKIYSDQAAAPAAARPPRTVSDGV